MKDLQYYIGILKECDQAKVLGLNLRRKIREALESAAGSQVSAILVGKMIWDAVANSHITNSRSCVQLGEEILAAVRSTPKEVKEEWISVDTPPESNKRILIRWINDNKKERTSIGFYAAKHTVEYMDDESQDGYGDYSEEKDEYYYPEGYHENPYEIPYTSQLINVTHWMYVSSLPAPPKEAEQNLGMCKERGCNSPATKDYNGYQYYVCDYHYNKLNDEFDEEYK